MAPPSKFSRSIFMERFMIGTIFEGDYVKKTMRNHDACVMSMASWRHFRSAVCSYHTVTPCHLRPTDLWNIWLLQQRWRLLCLLVWSLSQRPLPQMARREMLTAHQLHQAMLRSWQLYSIKFTLTSDVGQLAPSRGRATYPSNTTRCWPPVLYNEKLSLACPFLWSNSVHPLGSLPNHYYHHRHHHLSSTNILQLH